MAITFLIAVLGCLIPSYVYTAPIHDMPGAYAVWHLPFPMSGRPSASLYRQSEGRTRSVVTRLHAEQDIQAINDDAMCGKPSTPTLFPRLGMPPKAQRHPNQYFLARHFSP